MKTEKVISFPKYISVFQNSVDTIGKFVSVGKMILYVISQGKLIPQYSSDNHYTIIEACFLFA